MGSVISMKPTRPLWILFYLLLLAGSAFGAEPDTTDAARTVDPAGSGASYWGPIPAPGASAPAVLDASRSRPAWIYTLLVPYYAIAAPVWAVGKAAEGVAVFAGNQKWLTRLLRPRTQGIGVGLSVQAGGLSKLGAGISLFDVSPDHPGRFKLKLAAATTGSQRYTLGFRFPVGSGGELQTGAGYRLATNARFFGIGPTSQPADQSYYSQEVTWLGASLVQRVTGDFGAGGGVLLSGVGARAPWSEVGPPVSEEFTPPPPGYGERSDGLSVSLGIQHDGVGDQVYPEGGLRILKGSYFKSTDGSGVEIANARLDLQQFVKLGEFRTLALRGVLTVQDNVGSAPIPFQRLLSNARPDDMRGYKAFRWTDQGLLLFNFEYRWPLWALGPSHEPGVSAFLFSDVGQVFGDFSEITTRDLAISFGFGFRLMSRNGLLGKMEFGWSREEFVFRLGTDQIYQYEKGGLFYGRNPLQLR
jgi:hypothetical protein